MAIKVPPSAPPLPPLQLGNRTDQSSGLAQILSLAPGSNLNAKVEHIATATPEEREVLLNRTLRSLMLLTQAPASNRTETRNQFNLLLEQQQLLSSPQLQLVRLRVAAHQVLITYTDKPLQAGQALLLQMSADNRLLIQSSLEATLASRGPNNAAAPAPSGELAPSTTKLNSGETRELLASALRVLLPQKGQPDLLAALGTLRQLPSGVREHLFSPGLDQAINNLVRQVNSPQQLSNPDLLKLALQNSGVFFENKLAVARSGGDSTQLQNAPPAAQDVKGALLQVLHRVQQELPPGYQTPLPTVNPPHAPAQAPEVRVPPSLDLMQMLFQLPGKPRAELSDRVLRTQLMLLMQQHTLASLAKVQLQQLHTVNHQQTQADGPQTTQSWSFELPVRLGQEARTLEFRVDEERQEARDENGESQQKRRWQVTLSFDLAETGAFYAQLKVLDKQVSAHLWAERDETLEIARNRLDKLRQQLQDQGLEVAHLQCVSGAPTHKAVSLNYALVDIKT